MSSPSLPSSGAVRGRRDTSLLERREEPAALAPGMAPVYVSVRPIRVGEHLVPPGVEIPDMATWYRRDAWVTHRRVRLVAPGDAYETWDEFLARAQASPPTHHLESRLGSTPSGVAPVDHDVDPEDDVQVREGPDPEAAP